MKILAVDTSTQSGSVALLDGRQVIAEWGQQATHTHNRRLLTTIDALLQEVDWTLDVVDGFAVTIGPGSFTGIRIGISTMKTLAWVRGKPYVGIPTLDALAAPLQYAARPVCAVLDARKLEVYSALYEPDGGGCWQRRTPARVAAPAAILSEIHGPTLFCGDGWLLYREWFLKELGGWAIELPAPYHSVRAGFVGALAYQKFLQGETDDPVTSKPLYVRPPEAELRRPANNPPAINAPAA
jgi:tRNA threonylcarbamoyladenosine biosynthesis protein TsaB